jgi:hypothetical protein
MKQLVRTLGILLLAASILPSVYSQSSIKKSNPTNIVSQRKVQDHGRLVEEFSFWIKDFKVDHQGEHHNLNISISYRYVGNITKTQYPDFRWLAKDVETLLTNYPNEDDYWEIVNKQLTALLLKKYAGLMSVTIELKVDPSPLVPYTRSSRVTRQR